MKRKFSFKGLLKVISAGLLFLVLPALITFSINYLIRGSIFTRGITTENFLVYLILQYLLAVLFGLGIMAVIFSLIILGEMIIITIFPEKVSK